MFYSPTKEFVRFSTYRTAEIKALRERIQKQKVTQDQIESTQLRLLRLRKDYEELQVEQHSQLKDVYHNSERAIAELLKEKSLSEKQCVFMKEQFQALEKKRIKLQEEGAELEEQLRRQEGQKDKLVAKKVAEEKKIEELDENYEKVCQEVVKMEQLKRELERAQEGVHEKKQQQKVQWEEVRNENKSLAAKLKQQQGTLQRLKIEWETSEKQIQNQRQWISHAKLEIQLFKDQMTSFSAQKVTAQEDDWLVQQQKQLGAHLDSMLKTIEEETDKVEKNEQNYEKKIKESLAKVNEEEELKPKLQEKIEVARTNLRLLREKNQSLKLKMNSIFKNDSDLVSLLSSKKVYPNVKNELVQVVKKSAVQAFESKENIVLKTEIFGKTQQTANTSRAFSEVNRVM